MKNAGVLVDGFGRIKDVVHDAVEGLTAEELAHRIDPAANSVAWLIWHLSRIQDDHIAGAAGRDQLWTGGWADRFGLPLDRRDHGYGHSADQVAAVQVESGALLTDYHDAVHDQTIQFVSALADPDLARIVDTSFDPPVTLAVRLVSVISDNLQHAGQAAFLRGHLVRSRRSG